MRVVDDLEKFEIRRRYGTSVDEGLEVDDLVPVLAAVDDDQNLFCQLVGLSEGQDFEQFVHRAEAAGKDHQAFGEIGKPELAHEKVMELEVERWRDVLVRMLLEGELNIEADALASGFVSAQVSGFHDAGASAGGNHEAVAASGNGDRPLRQHVRQFARVFVIASHVHAGVGTLELFVKFSVGLARLVLLDVGQRLRSGLASLEAGRTEKYDRVLDLFAAKASERFLIFGKHTENAAVGTVEERFVLVGNRRGFQIVVHG